MKRFISIFIIACILTCLAGCSQVRAKQETTSTTAFTVAQTSELTIVQSEETTSEHTTLSEEESTLTHTTLPKTTTIPETTETSTEETTTEQPTFGLNIVRKNIGRFFGYEEAGVKSTEKPTKENGDRDFSYFDDSAFVGNSRIMDFGTFGFAKNVYASVGLTVDTVFTAKQNGVATINNLNGKGFSRVYLYFGDNECGWQSMEKFQEHYKRVIDAVKAKCPDAQIYLISVMPISRSADSLNKNGCNISSIRKINSCIKELAENEGVNYLDTYSSTSDSAGFLPDDAAGDGIHMKKKYIQRWAEFIYDNT